jgi:hypothetical protein
MTWLDKHRESEKFASEAEHAKRDGDLEAALSLYRQAAAFEAEALALVQPDKARTLGVTAVSAAALYFKAKEYELSEDTAIAGLARPDMPRFAKEDLKAILQAAWNERAFSSSGVKFIRGELLVSVSGGLVAVGAAPLELVHRKVEEIKNLYFRAVELLLNFPLRLHGPPPDVIREQFRPWLLQAPAGSYQFALRVETPRQMELFPNIALEVEDVTDRLLRIVEASSVGSIEQLSKVIPSEDYRACFVKQIRNLAPTGKTFDRLIIRSPSHEDTPPVVFSPQSRKILTDSLRTRAGQKSDDEGQLQDQITGMLRGVHLDKDWLDVTDEKTGDTIRIYQAGDAIDDVIGPMINHKVVVDVTIHKDGRRVFKDIQSYE